MTGLNKYDNKERRRKRRSNHSKFDLRYPKKIKHSPKPRIEDNDWKKEIDDLSL